MKICIVGGVAGGAGVGTKLRRLDEQSEIILFEKGQYISYANCGLPYFIGGTIKEEENLIITQPELLRNRFNIDVRINSEVMSINKEEHFIQIQNHETGEVYQESYDKLILSPGAAPKNMFPEASHYEGVFTLRTVPDSVKIDRFIKDKQPKQAVVVGGGFIGVEMAENLADRGLAVTIVEYAPHIVATMDLEMANILHEHLTQHGVSLLLNTGVNSLEKQDHQFRLLLTDNSVLTTDLVIMSVGVVPESSLAKDAGLDLGIRNTIKVDEYLTTSDPDIYALGDAINITNYITGQEGNIPLAGPANKQARNLAKMFYGEKIISNRTMGTAALKIFDLTAASVGLSEEQLIREKISYYKTYIHPGNHAGYYPGATPIQMKLLFQEDGKILGAQAVGYEGVEKRIDIIASSIYFSGTVYDLQNLELCYAPPYSSAKDPVNMLGFTAANILAKEVSVFYAEEIPLLDLTKVQLVNLNTPDEAIVGNIEGSIQIPLDSLRARMDKLDKSLPVYAYCMVGLRGYIGTRMLMQHGYDVHNLSGGYKTYKLVQATKSNWNAQTPLTNGNDLKTNGTDHQVVNNVDENSSQCSGNRIQVDACGLQCPGPIMKVANCMKEALPGDQLVIDATDPAFASDIKVWCERTGNTFLTQSASKGIFTVAIQKGDSKAPVAGTSIATTNGGNDKSIVVFSGDLDKAIATFIIANGAAAMGRKVTLFFTFWGLNILRRPEKVRVSKNLIEKMFGAMMPRGTKKLGLSRMNMGGMGAVMIKHIMKKKNVFSLDTLISSAMEAGVELIACQMSMDLMGIHKEELIDGVEIGGVATFLGSAENSDTNLFI